MRASSDSRAEPKNVLVASFALGLFAACALTGCGSSTGGPGRLTIQLSPSAPTLTVNSSVRIDAQTTPDLPKYNGSLTWGIQGYLDKCTEIVLDPLVAPAMPNCPNGWIAEEQPMVYGPMTQAYYYSPSTPGTYTVFAQGQIHNTSSFQKIDYEGSATLSINVTAP